MPDFNPSSLITSAACINGYGPGGWPIIEIGLLSRWASSLDAANNTDPATLISGVKCYACYLNNAWLLNLALLRNIALGLDPTLDVSASALSSAIECSNCYAPGGTAISDMALLTQIVLVNNPAADVQPEDVIQGGSMINGYSTQVWLMKLALLREISLSLNPSASVEAADLLASSQCYNCFGPGLWPLLEVELLYVIFTKSGVIPPEVDNFRITSDASFRITSDGGSRITTA